MSIHYLNPNVIAFPDVNDALTNPNGLLAAGGNLSKSWLIAAYRQGIFPWYEDGQPILWWSPDPRLSLKPDQFRMSRSLRKLVKKRIYRVSFDQDFIGVINGCRTNVRKSHGTWITNEMVNAYTELYDSGIAHSVEVWRDTRLIGGVYGVAIGAAFFGESMFSEVSNGSKIALTFLHDRLLKAGFMLFDTQFLTEHLSSLGAIEITQAQYLNKLDKALNKNATFLDNNYSVDVETIAHRSTQTS